ncbi:MAG: hypothetical protein A3K19_16240 [Lentisphaerae bacterium RIFOXYB12_FULL_65_16]|nr:MAG: hypothetical protein A3K18_11750 [Lentisphaerae bacterium RIFOXYA12_64_32]OGV90175.1 MAG: hypothetical protein A3K19_16240 [Lentisphaerae bacterium RIFOXYB12_FULL_65_16]
MTCTTPHPIGVGILGAGRPNIATQSHIPGCQRSQKVRIVALCDRLESVRDYAAQCGAKAYTDYAAMLGDPQVDVVHVATPDWCHCGQAEQALAAGKHVLLQKPPCVTLAELERLRQAVKRAPLSLKIALNTRETRLCRTVRKLLVDGAIGAVRHVRIAYRGHRFPIPDPASPYLKKEMGGVWIHNAMHWLDEASFYAGVLPTSVQVFTTRNDNGPPEKLGEGPNYWSARFEFGPDVTCHLEYNTMLLKDGLPGGMFRSVIGTEGELRQAYGSTELLLHRRNADRPEPCALLDAGLSNEEAGHDSFRRVVDQQADQMRDGEERAPKAADSLALMEALLAGAASAESATRVVLADGRRT